MSVAFVCYINFDSVDPVLSLGMSSLVYTIMYIIASFLLYDVNVNVAFVCVIKFGNVDPVFSLGVSSLVYIVHTLLPRQLTSV